MSKMPDGRPVEYIGDGVYAIYDNFGVWLHANHHLHPTDRVYLEPSVLKSLNQFVETCDNARNVKKENQT